MEPGLVQLRHCLIILSIALLSTTGWADRNDVEGRWLTQEKDGWIAIKLVGDSLVGSIAGSPNGDEEREFDDRNPDPALRDRPLQGLAIMTGFEYDGDGRWSGGKVYDPNSGKTYKCTLTQIDANTLRIRGYIGVSLFGRSETWTRDDD
jgi:uncharacterized protein (DUF2147 family)